MKRKFLAFLLAFVMIVGMLPMAALAAGETSVTPDADGKVTVSTEAELNAALSSDTANVKTITLTDNITLTSYVSVDKDVTIDFGGHTVTGAANAGCFDLACSTAGSTLVLKNGTLESKSWAVWVQNAGKLTVENGMTVHTSATDATKPAITVQNTGSTVTVNGTVKSDNTTAISGIGNASDGGVIINVGETGKVESTKDGGIYYPNTSTLTIDGSVKGNVAVYQKSGELIINESATLEATGDQAAYVYNGNGYNNTGDALVIDVCDYPGGAPIVKINGGTFTSAKAKAVAVYSEKKGSQAVPEKFIKGGTFSSDPTTLLADGFKATKSTVEGKDSWTVAEKSAEPTYYDFTLLDENTELLNSKKVADLGELVLAQDTTDKTKITITGTANYVEMTGFNSDVAAENAGHYVAINIPVTAGDKVVSTNVSDGAATGKVVEHEAEGNVELLVWMDGDRSGLEDTDPLKKGFTIAIGEDDAVVTYTIDFSGVTLLPKVAEGTNVEVKEDNSVEISKTDGGTTAGAKLPETLGSDDKAAELSTLKVEVKPATVDATNDLKDAATPEVIKEAVKDGSAKIVEITVKKIIVQEDGTTTETKAFNGKGDLAGTPITVTIGGLTQGTEYYLFCIMDDGTVTSYGFITPTGTTITFTTSHLCKFGAAPVAADKKAALVAAVAEDEENHESNTKVTGGTLTTPAGGSVAPSTDSTYTVAAPNAGLSKVEITGKNNNYYLIQVGDTAPAAIFCLKADGTTGKAEFYVANNSASTIKIWEAGASAPTFENGIPSGLAEVTEA